MDPKTSIAERKTNKRHCCVSGCDASNANNKEPSSLHRFPLRDKNLYLKWLKVLKIHKPLKEMYVCSRHFKENDFFGGWLAVEPNKRRLKRGVIPSLELPNGSLKRVKVLDPRSSLLDKTEDFAASLNLLPVKKKSNGDKESSIREPGSSKKNGPLHKEPSKPKETLSSDPDSLLILKRVGEIKEAPEFQAKKKYDAQVHLKKMRDIKRLQFKKLETPTVSRRPQVQTGPSKVKIKPIQELTQPSAPNKVEVVSKEAKIPPESPNTQIKKVRVLTHAEVESMKKSPNSQFKKIRVVTQSELKQIQLKPPVIRNSVEKSPIKSSNTSVPESNENNTSAETNLDINRIRKNVQELMVIDKQTLCNGNITVKNGIMPNTGRLKHFHDFMKKAMTYFDTVTDELNKTSLSTLDTNTMSSSSAPVASTSVVKQPGAPSLYDPLKDYKTFPKPFTVGQNSISETVLSLEKTINNLTKDEYAMNSGIPNNLKGTRDASIQTESDWELHMKVELDRTKNENSNLKNEILSLKNKITLLERQVVGPHTGQFLYFYKPT